MSIVKAESCSALGQDTAEPSSSVQCQTQPRPQHSAVRAPWYQPPVQRSECFQLDGDGFGSSVTGTDCGNLARADKLHSAQEEVVFSKTNATGEDGVSTL